MPLLVLYIYVVGNKYVQTVHVNRRNVNDLFDGIMLTNSCPTPGQANAIFSPEKDKLVNIIALFRELP